MSFGTIKARITFVVRGIESYQTSQTKRLGTGKSKQQTVGCVILHDPVLECEVHFERDEDERFLKYSKSLKQVSQATSRADLADNGEVVIRDKPKK